MSYNFEFQLLLETCMTNRLSLFPIAGELPRFQAGITMEISRLDAWYSDKSGTLECPATYIVKGLCRRCCLPEVILRSMQVSQQMELTNIYLFAWEVTKRFLDKKSSV